MPNVKHNCCVIVSINAVENTQLLRGLAFANLMSSGEPLNFSCVL